MSKEQTKQVLNQLVADLSQQSVIVQIKLTGTCAVQHS